MKKTYIFQYAYSTAVKVEIVEDTERITLKEAKKLWKKYLPDFIYRLENGYIPEMAIWENMKDDSTFNDKLIYADHTAETDGTRLWNTKREYIDLTLEK